MAVVRKPTPPSWITDVKGHKRQLERARWNCERIAEVFTDEPDQEFETGDLAKLVYGHNGKINRDKVRKHIPAQRNYMMARLNPIVTTYGPRGTIVKVKLYDRETLEDRRKMQEELERLRARKELTEERYGNLCDLLGLSS